MVSRELDKNKEKYDCNLCKERKYYKEKNCTGEVIPDILDKTTEDVRYVISNDLKIAINYCPAILFYKEEVMSLLDDYILFKQGFLPYEGGYYNQPYWLMKAFIELQSLENFLDNKELEKINGGRN